MLLQLRQRLRPHLDLWLYRALILAAMIWRFLLFRTTFIAITGSVGKSTAKEALGAILGSEAPTAVSRGTLNGSRSVARSILQTRPWHKFSVVEVGTDSPGWIRRSSLTLRPHVALILCVRRLHSDRFDSIDDTAREKASLLKGVVRGGTAILNGDDERVSGMADARRDLHVVRFGQGAGADVVASDLSSRWPERLFLTIAAAVETERFETRLVGTHWASSVLGAVAAARVCGVSLRNSARALATVQPFPGRMDPRPVISGAVILRDDFNGSVVTFGPAFEVLQNAQAARKGLVISSVSDSDESWAQRLRTIVEDAAKVVDFLILVGKKRAIASGRKAALAAGMPEESVACFESVRDSSDYLKQILRDGDLVLLRGLAADHLARLYFDQIRHVRCWVNHCPRMIVCDECPELFQIAPASRVDESSPQAFCSPASQR